MTTFEDKLVKILECISGSCNSSVRIFDESKGHSNRSVGFAAYEERQQRLKETSENYPEVIEFLCRKNGHNYFKFEGRTIKIVSSRRDNLGRNVFHKNAFERMDGFNGFDPLLRIIYSADYDLEANESTLLECYYLEIDRNTEEVVREINILELAEAKSGYVVPLSTDTTSGVELPPAGLQFKQPNSDKKKDNN